MKNGISRDIINTLRRGHEFKIEDIVGSGNYAEHLPDLFKIIQEAYILSKKSDEFSFQTLKEIQDRINDLNEKVEFENQRHKEAKESIGDAFKEELNKTLNEFSLPIVSKYRPEIKELAINNVDPLQGTIIMEASTAEKPEELQKMDKVTIPFDAHDKPDPLPEIVEDTAFEEVPQEQSITEEQAMRL